RLGRLGRAREGREGEAARAATLSIGRDVDVGDGPGLGEQLFQVLGRGAIAEVSYEDLGRNGASPSLVRSRVRPRSWGGYPGSKLPRSRTDFLAKTRPMSHLSDQAERRRTFAIISHPDTGKTTLTEQLLLFGGAIQLPATATARRA